MKKTARQEIIARIIKENTIGTQNELIVLLNKEGIDATQATVSRDIKEMRIVKQNMPEGGYKYCVPGPNDPSGSNPAYMTLLLGSVESTDIAMNTVVLKCRTGAAQAAAAALENVSLTGVAGTLAGDDTIFILCYSVEEARSVKNDLDAIFDF